MKFRLKGIKNVYEEIAEQYRGYIRLGVLSGGDKLPSCRELAVELGVNPNTVERAYALLESEGLVVAVPKKGVYVSENGNNTNNLLNEAEKQIAALRASGLTYDELCVIMRRVYNEEN